jgi:hypothetical protein
MSVLLHLYAFSPFCSKKTFYLSYFLEYRSQQQSIAFLIIGSSAPPGLERAWLVVPVGEEGAWRVVHVGEEGAWLVVVVGEEEAWLVVVVGDEGAWQSVGDGGGVWQAVCTNGT